eukprot:c1506_g1_i1.p1 GENE.c1506_g1_i1~~c1506_g1_i1.p1  ORF type:complete len:550 (+),score=103.58 c1506_g1_i1:37-1686(+)
MNSDRPNEIKDFVLSHITTTNFKSLDCELRIPLDQQDLVIFGPNGSGKTQIIWALLIFFRFFNTRVEHAKKAWLVLSHILADELDPNLADLSNFESFVKQTTPECSIAHITGFGQLAQTSLQLDCELQVNGVIQLKCDQGPLFDSKIGYAFIHPRFQFQHPKKETTHLVPLNNFSPNIRNRFGRLSEGAKERISNILASIFPGHKQMTLDAHGNLTVVSDSQSIEVMFTGWAFQKLVCTFVLLFTLIELVSLPNAQKISQTKYLLLEEPEAMLYPTITVEFFRLLRQECNAAKIRLILTSHDPMIVNMASARLPLCAGAEDTTGSVLVELIGSCQAPLLLLEGNNDVGLLKCLIQDFESDVQRCVNVKKETAFNLDRNKYENWLSLWKEFNEHANIVVLRDPDLIQNIPATPTKTAEGTMCVYWQLPSIESFVIFELFENHVAVWHAVATAIGQQTKFFSNVDGQELDVFSTAKNLVLSTSASGPSFEDAIAICRGIRGHKFWGKLSTPAQVFARWDVQNAHPQVRAMIRDTLSQLSGLLKCELRSVWE